ncbi:MAG: D-alanyl-D-alanine carboxypeptidase [Proteobacteria bacterium]|jgi:D-alanyl-D-alanine carboxypeptidase (penicillin-binding protein 5/6)|nr:D-alanyl-D-alanine carboxypeptidase [Pseudomonadota bacterium]MDB4826764.1 D-alanyl-D-alanine carboxypeptidase [Gammaproteobacteria bacterium]MBT5626281.1 D-alanyl-D-alanine carboxypeptidase [Pseudomonadota bacterium]MBT6065916.1 D-alanyl-D-alanine carboxypeptidase [Pseudomonadota bacterium]MBT6658079.1 D-alanyl-D-alanine carboxypeptidase [Pseudomonadota bacterium]
MQQTLEKFRQVVGVFFISIIGGLVTGSAVIASEVESDLEGAMRSTIPAPNLKVSSWLLMDAKTGLTLAANNPDAPVEPASLTKLMTAFIVFREIERETISLDDIVVVSEKAWRSEGSRMFIEVGDKVRIDDLLMGLVVQSGNDAAVALAEHVAGSEEGFADLMNQTASELGMDNSNFVNSAGMPHPDHYTTARDISQLARAILIDQPEHYDRYKIREFTWNGITQKNRNPLLGRDESIDGIKTGHTRSAGYCLVGSAQKDGMRLIGSVMGASGDRERGDAVYSLLRFGFAAYEHHDLYPAGEVIVDSFVFKGAKNSVALGLSDSMTLVLPKGAGKDLQASVSLADPVIAPISLGDELGVLSVSLAGEQIVSRPVVSLEQVAAGSLWQRLSDTARLWFY